jgi:hypothetical protein
MISFPIRHGLLMTTALVIQSFSACTHTVVRPMECPEPVMPSRSALAWSRGSDTISMRGSVIGLDSLMRPTNASVFLRSVDDGTSLRQRLVAVDSSGSFTIDSIPAGRYVLMARRIGFEPATDTIEVQAGASILVRAVLATSLTTLDGCGYVYVEKRVPWWIRK